MKFFYLYLCKACNLYNEKYKKKKNLVKTFPVTVSIGCFFSYFTDERRPDAVVSFYQSFSRLLSLRLFF